VVIYFYRGRARP